MLTNEGRQAAFEQLVIENKHLLDALEKSEKLVSYYKGELRALVGKYEFLQSEWDGKYKDRIKKKVKEEVAEEVIEVLADKFGVYLYHD